MAWPFCFTSMIMLETMLNAATRMIRVRIRNMTFRSTLSAPKKVAWMSCQVRTKAPGISSARTRAATASTRSGSSTVISIFVTPSSMLKNSCAVSSGMKR